jgi:hypothetical protein
MSGITITITMTLDDGPDVGTAYQIRKSSDEALLDAARGDLSVVAGCLIEDAGTALRKHVRELQHDERFRDDDGPMVA